MSRPGKLLSTSATSKPAPPPVTVGRQTVNKVKIKSCRLQWFYPVRAQPVMRAAAQR